MMEENAKVIDRPRSYRTDLTRGLDHKTPDGPGAEAEAARSAFPALKRLFTVKEAAMYLGTTYAAVYMKIWRGILPALRDGRRVRIERSELERYVSERMRPYEAKGSV